MTPKILFLTKYDSIGASSRYRVHQYLPFLQERGIEYSVISLFPAKYLHTRYKNTLSAHWRVPLIVIESYVSRLMLLWREIEHYDAIYVQYEAFPYLPFSLEKQLFSSSRPVVVDYDDAVYINYEQHSNALIRRLLGSKIHNIVKHSDHVIVGNHYLAAWAGQLNSNITLIPTSVDLHKYPVDPISEPVNMQPVIGWIGTPMTAKYLSMLEGPLQVLRTRHNFVLKVIGAPDFKMHGIDIVHIPWNEADEVRELQTCDIGVMPLLDDSWSRGKSALKLIQYLAAGIVGIASPVGANCDVVQDGQNGLLAATDEEWVEKLTRAIEQPEFRRTLAAAGRRTVESQYSIQANAPRWVDVLLSTLAN